MIKLRPPSLNIQDVASAELLVDGLRLPLLNTQLQLHHFLISEKMFRNAKSISLKVKFKNASEQIFTKALKHNWVFEEASQLKLLRPFKINLDSSYKNTDQNKAKILKALNERYMSATNEVIGTKGVKNLIYYSVGGNKDYLKLVKLSIESIFQTAPQIDFDVLFITPQSWVNDIEAIKPPEAVFKYHIIEDTDDGVEISKNKTKIFDFVEIDDYNKILFLDADILAAKDIHFIFDDDHEHEVLYVAINRAKVTFASHHSEYHGLKCLTREQVEAMHNGNQLAFNAGQFLFVNSDKMRKHFENVNWLMSVWPGIYFFEQSFMNHYFCSYNLTENSKLDSKVKLISTAEPLLYEKEIGDRTLIHFIAPALNPVAKVNFIKEYKDAYFPQ